MKDKVPFYEIVNMFFVGSVFSLFVVVLYFDSFSLELLKENMTFFADWAFLISAVLLVAMYEVGFILNKAGSVILAPILLGTIWPCGDYHVDVSEIAMKNTRFQSLITELILIRSHIMMFSVLTLLAFCNDKDSYAVTFIVLIIVFALAGKKQNERINTIREDYRNKKDNELQEG